VEAAMGNAGICTLNALQPAQYAGTTYGRPGQIPGSVTVAAAHLLDPETNTFLPAEALRKRLSAVGAMDRPVIAYCGGGIAATADALALVMLGHTNVKVYDASLSEWAKDETLPIAAG
jgi:thiosulfate/3-mercaptopyruvate sulfurtransferase